jgi:hypothetical protein
MLDYETAATHSAMRLKERQAKELEELKTNLYENGPAIKYTLSKELMNLRATERLMF